MELLLLPVPLFDKNITAEAYILRYRFSNHGMPFAPNRESPLLQTLEYGGVEAFAGGNQVFVPIQPEALPELVGHCTQTPELTVFLLDAASYPIREEWLRSLRTLKGKGYSIGATQSAGFIGDDDLLDIADYILFDAAAMKDSRRREHIARYKNYYRKIRTVATGIDCAAAFKLAKSDGFHMFEGMFYRVPATGEARELPPGQEKLVRLLLFMLDSGTAFKDVSDKLRRDAELTYSFMRFINSPYLRLDYKLNSVQQAVSVLGPAQVRKWLAATVFRELSSRPAQELSRLSLVRAWLTESAGKLLGIAQTPEDCAGLFMTGLYSALDAILDSDMETALSMLRASGDAADAILRRKGRFYPALELALDYGNADWQSVVRDCMIGALEIHDVYGAYLEAVGWYHELTAHKARKNTSREADDPRSRRI